MEREQIIRMAQEAGFREPNPHDGCMGIAYDYRNGTDTGASLERFAALVASAEREECKKLCTWKTGNQFVDEAIAVCYRAIDQRGQA